MKQSIVNMSNYHTVGITGHRDIRVDKLEEYKEEIKAILQEIKTKTEKKLLLVSPLADGADRLFIDAGKELGFEYIVVLPMPINIYAKDFSAQSLVDFNGYLVEALRYEVIELVEGNTLSSISSYGFKRDLQYQAVGRLITECSDMIALWDGIENNKMGGTADIVSYRKAQNKTFHHILCQRNF